ncbi:PTS sugar transporter subunit IIA [Pediococcus sp. M21F004]|uniref:PTS sugar transporter subunit IIA n=1 Tax=Pediococcus sp. M21F004 TaxID=3390033 RepID=UPI003DA745C7
MHYRKYVKEGILYLENIPTILPINQLAKAITPYLPGMSVLEIKDCIKSREQIGDTFIGNQTVILHVSSEKIEKPFCLYALEKTPVIWKSAYSEENHQVMNFVVLVINPKKQDLEFKQLSKFLQFPDTGRKQFLKMYEKNTNLINWL